MRRLLQCAVLGAALGQAPAALACGGGFGQGLQVHPSQKIVIQEKNGIESYTFSPHFCGAATQFGLILPVPAQLTGAPALAKAELVTELDALSAPRVEEVTECSGGDKAGGLGAGGGSNGFGTNWSGTHVIDQGQVGIFDYAVLKADTKKAFTDWLDTNGFPYDAAQTAPFDDYVAKGWYFVAFKVTTGDTAPPQGSDLCGDLGPLTLSFPADPLVVPARIAAVDTQHQWEYSWQVYTIGASYETSASNQGYSRVSYADTLTAADLAKYPEIAAVAGAGDHVTKLSLSFYGAELSDDIMLMPNTSQTAFRDTVTHVTYKDCGGGPFGCSFSASGDSHGWSLDALVATLGLAFAYKRRRQPRP